VNLSTQRNEDQATTYTIHDGIGQPPDQGYDIQSSGIISSVDIKQWILVPTDITTLQGRYNVVHRDYMLPNSTTGKPLSFMEFFKGQSAPMQRLLVGLKLVHRTARCRGNTAKLEGKWGSSLAHRWLSAIQWYIRVGDSNYK